MVKQGAAFGVCLMAAVLLGPFANADVTVHFRNGEAPTASYSGARDIIITDGREFFWEPNVNYQRALRVDQYPALTRSLLRFDLSSIPTTATAVTSVTLHLYVRNSSAGPNTPVRGVLRSWNENAVTWQTTDGTTSWQAAGASGTTDVAAGEYCSLNSMSVGATSCTFNAAGLSKVLEWLQTPAANFGLLLEDTSSESTEYSPSEDANTSRRPRLVVNYQVGSSSFSASFQDGVDAYAGTTDAAMGNGVDPKTLPFNGHLALSPGTAASTTTSLLRFDLSSVPPWAKVSAASLTVHVRSSSTTPVSIHEVLRSWSPTAATWLTHDAALPWQTPGGFGATDRAATPFSSFAIPLGEVSHSFDASGVALVERWLQTPADNFGLRFEPAAGSSEYAALTWSGHTVVTQRPRLSVTYVEGSVTFSGPAATSLGASPSAFRLQRASLTTRAIDGTVGALTSTVSASGGELSASSTGPWSTSLAVSFSSGSLQSGEFYVRSSGAGTVQLTVDAGQAWQGETSQLDVLPAPAGLVVSGPGALGVGAASPLFTVTRHDAGGNPVTAGALTVALSSDSPDSAFASTPASNTWTGSHEVTIPDGASTATFSYRDGRVGVSNLTALAAGVPQGVASVAVGPVSFAADFESGTLLLTDAPVGPAASLYRSSADVSLSTDASAAHRGTLGFRLTDSDTTAALGSEGHLRFPLHPRDGAFHLRMWMRLPSQAGTGDDIFVQVLSLTGRALADARLRFPERTLRLAGFDAADAYVHTNAGLLGSDGGWRLVELEIQGAGSLTGARRLYVDGALAAEETGLDWTGMAIERVVLGLPWSDQNAVSTYDFDDVRGSPFPQASRIGFEASPPSAATNVCLPVQLTLRDTPTQSLSTAPYPVEAVLPSSPALSFHADVACASPVSTHTVPAGSSMSTLYVRASAPGTYVIAPSHSDFLPPDAGLELVIHEAPATGAPVIASPGNLERLCGATAANAAVEAPVVTGEGPFRYSLEPLPGQPLPEGLTVDAETGVLHWNNARQEALDTGFILRVTDASGASSTSTLHLNEICRPAIELRLGCGCNAGGGSAALLSALLLLLHSRAFQRRTCRMASAQARR